MRGCARALGRVSSFQIGRYDHLGYKVAVWLNAEGLLLLGGGVDGGVEGAAAYNAGEYGTWPFLGVRLRDLNEC